MIRAAALAGLAVVAVARSPVWASVPPAPPTSVVLVVTDDQPYGALPPLDRAGGATGSLAEMPYLSGRPGGGWTEFTRAYLNQSLCCPSRASILTGRHAHRTGVTRNSLGDRLDDDSTIAAALSDAGYRTGLVGKYLNRYPFGREPFVPHGWDEWAAFVDDPDGDEARSDKYYDYTLAVREAPGRDLRVEPHGRTPSDYSTDVLAAHAVAFVERAAHDDRPFLLVVAPHAPHLGALRACARTGACPAGDAGVSPVPSPRDVPPPGARRPLPTGPGDGPAAALAVRTADATADRGLEGLAAVKGERDVDRQRRNAGLAMRAVDRLLTQVDAALTRTGRAASTAVIVMTDNGYSFGEHGWVGKNCAHDACSRTPLLLRVPGQERHREVVAAVSNVDVAPTIAALAGVEDRFGDVADPDGVSLLDDVPSGRAVLLEDRDPRSRSRYWAVTDGRWKYVVNDTGERELYDLVADPDEVRNRCRAGRCPAPAPALHAALSRLCAEAPACPRAEGGRGVAGLALPAVAGVLGTASAATLVVRRRARTTTRA